MKDALKLLGHQLFKSFFSIEFFLLYCWLLMDLFNIFSWWLFRFLFHVKSNANKVQASSDAEQTNHFSPPMKTRAVGKEQRSKNFIGRTSLLLLKTEPLIFWSAILSLRKGATKKQRMIFLRNQNFISRRVRERLIFAGVRYIISTHVRLQLKGPVPDQLVY